METVRIFMLAGMRPRLQRRSCQELKPPSGGGLALS